NLVEITSRAFQLGAEDRHPINIQFIVLPRIGSVTGFGPAIPHDPDFFLEANHRGLTEEKKRAFADELKPMLTQGLGAKRGTCFSGLLGMSRGMSSQVPLLSNEVIPEELTSRPMPFRDLERRAAA